MSKLTKKEKIIQEKLDPNLSYSVDEAMEILQSVKSEKFDESIDIAVKLGVDPNQSDQNVRGAVTLPNSLGKEVVVAVFADGDHASDASAVGADYVGMEDLAEEINHFRAKANCFSFFRGKGICCVLPAIRTDLISKRGLTLFTDFEKTFLINRLLYLKFLFLI